MRPAARVRLHLPPGPVTEDREAPQPNEPTMNLLEPERRGSSRDCVGGGGPGAGGGPSDRGPGAVPTIPHPYQLLDGRIVIIELPIDITADEVEAIKAWLLTLAVDR